MQITSKFTIAIHIIACIDYFQDKVTSSFLSGSIGANPVIIRNVMLELKNAGIINISQGKSGIKLNKNVENITFYDIYKAVDCIKNDSFFHFHEKPNGKCPVGKNIHFALDNNLVDIERNFEKELKKYKVSDVIKKIKFKNKRR